MRFLEILLSFANLLAFLALAIPLPQAVPWMRHLALLALPAALAQLLAEGPRTQMIPAYVLAGVLILAWLLQIAAPGVAGMLAVRRLAVGLGILGLAVSIALPVLFPVVHFPRPGGPYDIGTLTYHWVDAGRPEVFSADAHARRELMAQVWYPAKRDPAAARTPYVQDADALASAFPRVQHKTKLLFGNLPYMTGNAIPSAPVAEDESSYPVLLFLEGLTGFRQMNTFQVEELASHGYIVVALDQPYAAAVVVFPDGRQAAGLPVEQIKPLVGQSYLPAEPAPMLNGRPLVEGIVPYFAQDALFALRQLDALNQADPNGILAGRLDLQRMGILGVSLGGLVAGETCRLEPRLRACLVMDAPMSTGVVREGLKQPAMWITRDAGTMRLERQRAGGWPEAEIEVHQTSMRATYESLPGDGYFVQVPGMFHINLTDVPSWSPIYRLVGIAGPTAARRVYSIINACSLAFFDRHLKGQPATRFDGLAERYPEATFEARRP